MQQVNSYIYFSSIVNDHVQETNCLSRQDDNYVYLDFTLGAKDCSFDLKDKSHTVSIKIAKNYFEKYGEQFDVFIEKQSICCDTQSKVLSLIHCSFEGIQRKVFLESIILYLLFQVQKNSLISQANCGNCSFLNKAIDVEKIKQTKDYILHHLKENFTIASLASVVGTNQCYLKKGFKEVIGMTIFEFVQENRMMKAQHLLVNTNMPISDVCMEVGYSSTSSFSQAYKNYFGIPPSSVSKKEITLS